MKITLCTLIYNISNKNITFTHEVTKEEYIKTHDSYIMKNAPLGTTNNKIPRKIEVDYSYGYYVANVGVDKKLTSNEIEHIKMDMTSKILNTLNERKKNMLKAYDDSINYLMEYINQL